MWKVKRGQAAGRDTAQDKETLPSEENLLLAPASRGLTRFSIPLLLAPHEKKACILNQTAV